MNHGLKKGQALMARAAAAYRAGKYDSMQEALRGESRKRNGLVVERDFPYHDSSGDFTRRRNGKGGGRRGSKSKALAKGQGLMQQAAAAYRAGRYPTMQAALKGVAALERRQIRANKGRR